MSSKRKIATEQAKVRTARLADLKPAPYNPRRISPEALAGLKASITRFGLVQPIIVNKRTGFVVGGHQRVRALQEAGEKTAPVIEVDLPPGEERALNLALNSRHIEGEWTEDLRGILDDVKLELPELFADLHLGELFGDVPKPETPEIVEDEVPEVPAVPVTKVGDLWVMGGHRLLCGDATKAGDVGRLMGDETAALLSTDPPYGVDYANVLGGRENQKIGGWQEIEGDNLDDVAMVKMLESAFSLCAAKTAFVWHSWKRVELFLSALRSCGFVAVGEIVWVKNALVFGRSDYQWRHECCIYAKRKGAGRQDDRTATTVWEFPKSTGAEHPTSKPVGLFAIPITNHTQKGEVAYEPFAGSGPQFIAAEQLSRRCYGLEIEPRYCDVIVERWQNLTGGKAQREGVAA